LDPPAWRTGLRDDLLALAADAARRAWELAGGLSPDAGLSLSPDCDLARRAEHALGTPAFAALAANTGVSGPELTRQALAWRYGTATGLEVLRAERDPGAEVVCTQPANRRHSRLPMMFPGCNAQPLPPCSALELRCGTLFLGKHEGGHRGYKHIVPH
jgi:hypothetical protein